jgi:hypothetical protein
MLESVNHPQHYGGKDNPYESIKVIQAWKLGFCLGNTVKYISRAGKKDPAKEIEDLEKAKWYLEERINELNTSTVSQPDGILSFCVIGSTDELIQKCHQLLFKGETKKTLRQLETAIGVSKSTLSRFMNERTIDVTTLSKIARYVNRVNHKTES